MGVLHVKVKYWRIFCDVISLLAPVFILSSNIVSKEVSMKKIWNFSMAQFLWYDCTFKKARYRPCDLDIWPMKVNLFSWIEYNHISILYKFQIDISSNSREIKYQNIGRTHRYTHTHRQTDRHTHRQTGWKQYLATPSGGEVIIANIYNCACHSVITIFDMPPEINLAHVQSPPGCGSRRGTDVYN